MSGSSGVPASYAHEAHWQINSTVRLLKFYTWGGDWVLQKALTTHERQLWSQLFSGICWQRSSSRLLWQRKTHTSVLDAHAWLSWIWALFVCLWSRCYLDLSTQTCLIQSEKSCTKKIRTQSSGTFRTYTLFGNCYLINSKYFQIGSGIGNFPFPGITNQQLSGPRLHRQDLRAVWIGIGNFFFI